MKIKLLTVAAVIALCQIAIGGTNFAGFSGTFTTDSLYHSKSERTKAPLVAGVGDPGRTKAKVINNTSRNRQIRLPQLFAGR